MAAEKQPQNIPLNNPIGKNKILLQPPVLRLARFSIKNTPHVQSIEEKDPVTWFQSTFLSGAIWEGNNDGRKSQLSSNSRAELGSAQGAQNRRLQLWRMVTNLKLSTCLLIPTKPLNRWDDGDELCYIRKTRLSKHLHRNLSWLQWPALASSSVIALMDFHYNACRSKLLHQPSLWI